MVCYLGMASSSFTFNPRVAHKSYPTLEWHIPPLIKIYTRVAHKRYATLDEVPEWHMPSH